MLSVVVEVEHGKLFGPDAGPMVAVIAETTTNGSFRARLDRVGRPEIKNFIMMDKAADAVNRDLDVRDLYSEEDGFKLRPDYLGAYRARLNGSMAVYDSLDGKTDWPLDEKGTHPLTEMLLADFLVVDMSKPFDEDGYLEIERAMLRGRQPQDLRRAVVEPRHRRLATHNPDQQRQRSPHFGRRRSDSSACVPQLSLPLEAKSDATETTAARRDSHMMDAFSPGASLRTTDGTIALSNLEAQIDGLERAIRGELASHPWAQLIDLLTLRAQIIGRIADYERAAALAEQRVHEAPADGFAFLARARTRASLHRFDEALADLDTAERLGLSDHELEAERAAVLQAVGRYDEAMALRRIGAERHADFESLAGLASLHAELGEIAFAERLFDESCKCFRSVSPFPIAQLEFQRGHMWFAHGDLDVAHQWFDSGLATFAGLCASRRPFGRS